MRIGKWLKGHVVLAVTMVVVFFIVAVVSLWVGLNQPLLGTRLMLINTATILAIVALKISLALLKKDEEEERG